MSAPKLLDKRTVSAELANQKAQSIKQGLDLAKKVDALRETKVEEEGNLERFRIETIALVQTQIDAKIKERDKLEKSLVPMRMEYQRLLTPPDLTQAWEDIATTRNELQTVTSTLELKDKDLKLGIALNIQRERENKNEAQRLETMRQVAEKFSQDADNKFTQASEILERAQKQAQKVISEVQIVEGRLKVREEQAIDREVYLSKEETRIQAWEVDLAMREKKLKSRQELFIKSQNYIKNK